MRVAYVTADPGVPVFGRKGCSVHVQGVLAALLARGDDVKLFTPRLGGDAPSALHDVSVQEIRSLREKDEAARHAVKLARMNDELRGHLEAAGPFDAVYERYSLWSHAAMEVAEEAGIPGILEVNAPLVEEQAQHRGLAHPESAREGARRVFAAASLLIPVSEEVGSYLVAQGADPERVHVVYNGVDPARFSGFGAREVRIRSLDSRCFVPEDGYRRQRTLAPPRDGDAAPLKIAPGEDPQTGDGSLRLAVQHKMRNNLARSSFAQMNIFDLT